MKKIFSTMMEGFAKDMSEEDKKKMKDFGEKMTGMCSCMNIKEMSADEKKKMAERMMTCCGGAKEMMSTDQRVTSGFFKKAGSQPDEAEKSEKA
jgi:hypothetical protein